MNTKKFISYAHTFKFKWITTQDYSTFQVHELGLRELDPFGIVFYEHGVPLGIYICIYIYMRMYIYVYAYVYMYIYVYAYVYMNIYIYMNV